MVLKKYFICYTIGRVKIDDVNYAEALDLLHSRGEKLSMDMHGLVDFASAVQVSTSNIVLSLLG